MTHEVRLSTEQQAIIDHPLEAVRVAAGAGTGKTSTIVWRLRSVIERHDLRPEQALGLTFTNKAAEELADRLRRELPHYAAEGREVEVGTYHGYAYRLLQEFGAFVGFERDTAIIGPGYVRQILSDVLAQGVYEHLDLTAPAHRVAEAAHLARQLADNLASPDALASLRATGDVELRRRELARIVAAYRTEKRRLGVADYGDLIAKAHELVTAHPSIRDRIGKRYRLVLLDEYQDTDPAQRELLRTLFAETVPVTAVGDADQTIYEWRGASLENFAAFPVHFPAPDGTPAPTLPLSVNRRSDRAVLDLANAIRAEVHNDFTPLTGERPGGFVGTAHFRTAVEEALWIAEEVRRLHDEEEVPWSEIAILFRKNRHMDLVRDALAAEGVPFEVVSLGGLLAVPEVVDLHCWLRVLADPADSAALVRLLRYGRYRLGLGDLAAFARWVRDRNRAPQATHGEEGPGWPLLEAIDRLEEIDDLTSEALTRLTEFRAVYRRLLSTAQGVALVELCRRILDEVGAWTEVEAMEPEAGLSARLNLYRFLDLAESWSPLEGRPSLDAFLGYLDTLADERAADELDTASVGREDAVPLLTVHRAKGLEWDVVFLPAIVQKTFPATSQGFDNPLRLPKVLPFELRLDRASLPDPSLGEEAVTHELRERHAAQEWRTAYVAVTRARHRCYLTAAHWYGGKHPVAPSRLFEIAASINDSRTLRPMGEPGDRPDRLVLPDTVDSPDPVFGPGGWTEALRTEATELETMAGDSPTYHARVDQMRMMLEGLPDPPEPRDEGLTATSVTGLVTLATCPRKFFWSEVERLPRRPSRAAELGTRFHRRIELHHQGMVPLHEVEPDLYDLTDADADRPVSAPDPFEAFVASRFATTQPAYVEAPIDLRIGDLRVRGRIDAVYRPAPDEWEIVDFKSGRDRGEGPGDVQLQAYALAAQEGAVAPRPPDRLTVTFAFFGGGELTERSHVVDDEWARIAALRLEGLAAIAKGPEYPATPSDACARCDFLRFCDDGRARVGRDADPVR